MKKAARVFIIIGMIFGFWMVFPIIIGKKNLHRIDNNIPLTVKNKVIVLLFVNTLAGIFLLCDHSDESAAPVAAE